MYEPGLKYMRTPEEFRDVFLAWKRDDKAFFAAGACHILAHMFLSLHYGDGYQLIYEGLPEYLNTVTTYAGQNSFLSSRGNVLTALLSSSQKLRQYKRWL